MLGDALWAMMIAGCAGALAPQPRLVVRTAAAYMLCAVVEVNQRYHTPALDTARASTLGHLMIGSGFDPRDRASDGLGVALAALLKATALARRTTRLTRQS